MSLKSEEQISMIMSTSDKLAQAPRLSSGGIGYSAWKDNMHVYLQRAGAEGIHCKVMKEVAWVTMTRSAEEWASDELASALALISEFSSDGSSSSSSSSTKVEALTDSGTAPAAGALSEPMKAARKLVTATVERSRKAYGIIYTSLPDELRPQIGHIPNGWAYGLWHWLETKFQSTEEDSVGDLLALWTQLRQDDDESFDSYRARVNKLRELLKNAKEEPSARMYAYILLDRLHSRYKPAILALKAGGQMKDASVIAWDTVTAFINAHERSEQRSAESDVVASAKAMAVGGATPNVHQSWSNVASSSSTAPGTSMSASSSNGGTKASSNGRYSNSMENIQCFHCQQFGHMKNACPKNPHAGSQPRHTDRRPRGASHSPSGDNRNRTNRNRSPSRQNAVSPQPRQPQGQVSFESSKRLAFGSASAAISRSNPYASLRCNDDSEDSDIEEIVSRPTSRQPKSILKKLSGGDHCSALVAAESAATTGKVSTKSIHWGVDSMASLHISGNKSLFTGLKRCNPVKIEVANSEFVTAKYRGTVYVNVKTNDGGMQRISFKKVYFNDQFSSNLLSSQVLAEQKWSFHCTPEKSWMTTPGGNRIMLDTRGRVTMMTCSTAAAATPTTTPKVLSVGQVASTKVDELVRLHHRLGHVSFFRTIAILESGKTLDVGKLSVTKQQLEQARERITQCPICIRGKGRRSDFGHRGVDRGQKPGEVLHMDTFVVKHAPDAPVEYGLTITEGFAKWRWFSRQTNKDDIPAAIVTILRNAQTQMNCKVKRLHADGGTEFVNQTLKSFCRTEGIELRYPPARTQQLNGIAESAVRWTKDTMRVMMTQSGMPTRFWHRAAAHTTYLWNRTMVSELSGGKTPYESLFGRKPSAKHWGVFGCNAYYHIARQLRGASLAPKMEPCIYLGHDSTQNCALIWSLAEQKVIPTRDVVYHFDKFTFAKALNAGDDHVQEILDNSESPDDVIEEVADSESELNEDEAVQLQGGRVAAPSDELDDEVPSYDVECIVAQRKRKGALEYKVRWTGYDEETWEPASQLEIEVPDVVQHYLANRPGPRKSPRLHDAGTAPSTASAVPSSSLPAVAERKSEDESDIEHDSESDDESDDQSGSRPQVHMAMSAMRSIQSVNDRLHQNESHVVHAVTAGVSLLEEQTPQTYRAAMASPDAPKWRAAMDKEMASCEDLKVWTLVRRTDLPAGANVLPPKWVFKIKTDEAGNIVQHKARVTPKGFLQKAGKDYFEVFARTGSYKTKRVGLSLTAKWDHELHQMDVPTAFLWADVEEDIFMELPEGYREGREGYVCHLKKSLYGLKQAPRNWYLLVSKFITSIGFKATVSDPCLFYRRSSSGRLILLFLFVDDFQVSFHRDDTTEWNQLKAQLVKRFNTKDIGESTWILGMRIHRDRKLRTITLSQELYVTKALEKYGLAECKIVDTPEVVGVAHAEPTEEQKKPADRQRFMEITGTLMYAAIATRPDIAHAVHYLASNMLAPTQLHMKAAERVLRYLAGTKEVGLIFGSRNGDIVGDSRGRQTHGQIDICAYSDADWANSRVDRKSVTGWVAKLNGDPISWASKKQRIVALSTCEAELYAKAAAIQEVLWLRGLMKELGLNHQTGSTVHGDNQSAISVAKNGIRSDRTKHVDVKYHFVTESIESGEVVLKWVSTHDQQADIFTKALPTPAFHQFRKQLMTQ
jgi:hypothetical protein